MQKPIHTKASESTFYFQMVFPKVHTKCCVKPYENANIHPFFICKNDNSVWFKLEHLENQVKKIKQVSFL